MINNMQNFINLYKKNQQIINYLIVGILTTLVSLTIYYICVLTFLNPANALQLQIANVISWICAVLFSYVANKIFVFMSRSKNIIKEIVSFLSSRVLTLLIDMLIMFVMVTALGINDKISKLFVQVVVTILNYVFSKLFVFKKK